MRYNFFLSTNQNGRVARDASWRYGAALVIDRHGSNRGEMGTSQKMMPRETRTIQIIIRLLVYSSAAFMILWWTWKRGIVSVVVGIDSAITTFLLNLFQ
jgi:hypothetical protein